MTAAATTLVDAPPDVLGEALTMIRAGISVMPIGTEKKPVIKWEPYQDHLPTEAEVRQWFATGRRGLGVICGPVSGGLEMLEFEGRAVEDGTLKAFITEMADRGATSILDRLTDGWSERTPSGGLHFYYRTPDVGPNTKLAKNEGEEQPNGRVLRKDLIETRGVGGYSVVAPSYGATHETGRPWERIAGGPETVPELTAAERTLVFDAARGLDRPPPTPDVPDMSGVTEVSRPAVYDGLNRSGQWMGETVADFNRRTSWPEVLAGRFTEKRTKGDVVYWHFVGADNDVSATTNATGNDTLIVFSGTAESDGWAIYDGSGPAPSYDRFSAHVLITTGRDDRDARVETARGLRDSGYGPPPLTTQVVNGTESQLSVDDTEPSDLHLPPEFWSQRLVLEHIQRAAYSRLVSPDAVLHATLARVAAITPHTVELPPTVGGAVGLTYCSVLAGPPSSGKSAAMRTAVDLLAAPDTVVDLLPVGTGEGMVEVLFEFRDREDAKGKTTKVKEQTRHAAVLFIDEGQALTDLGGRQGSTILSTIRSAWTHSTLGNANASLERRRILKGENYVYGVVMALQPELAGPLLADAAAGTPQRFMWATSFDPTIPEEVIDWPGPLAWTAPTAYDLGQRAIGRNGYQRHPLTLDSTIVAELRAHRLAAARGNADPDPMTAHGMLARLKVAALLAILDDRLDVNLDDWRLAGTISDTSCNVRSAVQANVARAAQRDEDARTSSMVRRTEAVESNATTKALFSAARSAGRVVHRHAAANEHGDGWCTRRCVMQAIAGKHRQLVSVDDALERAVEDGTLRPEGDGWRPGRVTP